MSTRLLTIAADNAANPAAQSAAQSDGQLIGVFYAGAYIVLGVSVLLALVRLLRGPNLADRVVALDLMAFFAAAVIALAAITTGRSELIMVAIVLSLLMFMGTVAFAMYLERKGRTDAE